MKEEKVIVREQEKERKEKKKNNENEKRQKVRKPSPCSHVHAILKEGYNSQLFGRRFGRRRMR